MFFISHFGFRQGAIALALAFCGLTVQFVSAQENISYYSIDPEVFVQSAIQKIAAKGQNLNLQSPSRLALKEYFQNSGEAADLYVVGLLARMLGGNAFYGEYEYGNGYAVDRVASLNLEELRASADFGGLSEEHRKLLVWILSQPDGSIRMEDLLAQSTEIAKGDVFKALTVGWDILSSGWARNLSDNGRSRAEYPRTKKLAYLPHVKGDAFPSYYHFWGTMTYAYYVSSRSLGAWVYPESLTSAFIAIEEGLGWPKRKTESAIQRVEINFAGARVGAKLFRQLRKFKSNPETYIAQNKPSSDYIVEQKVSVQKYLAQSRAVIKKASVPIISRCQSLLSAKMGFDVNETDVDRHQ